MCRYLPAGAAAADCAVAVDSLPGHVAAAEVLGIDMQQLAGAATLVTDSRVTVGSRQARAAEPTQHLADRRGWPLEHSGQHQRPCAQVLPPRKDLLLELGWQPPRGCRFGVEGRSTNADQPPS
jgi:hypothetical protein